MERTAEWAVGGAIEHGAFMMAFAAVALTCLIILSGFSGVIAYFRVKHHARKAAISQADETAREVAERVANLYLQAEIPSIVKSFSELGQDIDSQTANEVAEKQEDDDE